MLLVLDAQRQPAREIVLAVIGFRERIAGKEVRGVAEHIIGARHHAVNAPTIRRDGGGIVVRRGRGGRLVGKGRGEVESLERGQGGVEAVNAGIRFARQQTSAG